MGWWISVPLHLAFLGLAGVVMREQFFTTEPPGQSFSCGWAPPHVEFDRLSYPRDSTDPKPLLADGPLTFLPAKPSGQIGLWGYPAEPPFHNCGSCQCFRWLYELPPSVRLALELRWWRPEVLAEKRTGPELLQFRMIERRRHSFKVGVFSWR